MSGDERKERGVENGVKEEKMRDRSERKKKTEGEEGMRWREREVNIEVKTGRRWSKMLNEEEESYYKAPV